MHRAPHRQGRQCRGRVVLAQIRDVRERGGARRRAVSRWPCRGSRCRYRSVGADRDLERQLGQAAAAAPAAVARRAPARRRLSAGDEARRRRVRRAARRRAVRARLRGRRSTARRRGTASRSCRGSGSTTWSTGSPGAPGSRIPRRARCRRRAAASASSRCTCRTGATPGSEHYQYKLAWLASLRDVVAAGPKRLIVCGDMNIAPTDEDVFDPDAYVGHTHVTPPERDGARRRSRRVGLHDVVRDHWPGQARLHLLGLPGRHVPPGPRHADRPGARRATPSPSASRRRGSTARPARARARAITRR